MAAPDAGLSELHSFRMLPGPAPRDGRILSGNDDPMISNSIANQSLRERISRAFQDRGYALDERNPDFGVAFYATAHEKLDVTTWDYGYPFYPRWGHYGPPMQTVTQYTEGSVIIDVVKPGTGELLWRGADVDNANSRGETALVVAARNRRFDTALCLVGAGACWSLRRA